MRSKVVNVSVHSLLAKYDRPNLCSNHSWVLLLGENYSCHFWLPIIFHFTFLILFLYSVLKVHARRVRRRVFVRACRTPYSRRGICLALVSLYTDLVLADRLPPPRLSRSSLDEFDSRIGTGGSPVVGSNGLEPSTSRLSGVRSNHLSYEPISVAGRFHRPNLFAAALHCPTPRLPHAPLDVSETRLGSGSLPLVETNRIELSTPCLQGRCSPS